MSADALDAGLLITRIAVGLVFVAHGAKHFINRDKTIAWTASIGFERPVVQWAFMTFAEIGIGLGLAIGLLTSVAAAGAVAMMLVAHVAVHRAAGFWITARPDEGYEYVLVLSLVSISLAVTGPGGWSLDHALGTAAALDEGVGLAIIGGGVLAAVAQLVLFYRPASDQVSDS